MPSHTSNADGSNRIKSNGRSISTAEWRANQLADKLAKNGALESPLREEADKLIKTAGETLRQAASRLGVVTHAASDHCVVGTKEDGTKYSITKRDSTPMPQALAKSRDEGRLRAIAAIVDKQPALLATPRTAAPLVPPTFAQARTKRRRAEDAALELAESEHLQQLVADTAARGTLQPGTATDRLAALRRRVVDKCAGRAADSASGQ